MEKYSCSLCTAAYVSNKDLYRHVRCKHPVGNAEKFTCALCGYSTPRADSLKQHQKTVHQGERETANTQKFCCDLCPATFGEKKSLYRHIRCKHPVGVAEKFTCGLCEYSSPRADALKKHENAAHLTEHQSQVLCALCEFTSPKRKGMLHHYSTIHGLTLHKEIYEFANEDDFYEWKNKVEKDTLSEFVRVRGQCVRSADRSTKLDFKCHRDGIYKARGNNVRHLKLSGSNKIGGHCPSRMDVTRNASGEIKVIFTSTHVGHQSEIGRLRLSKSKREEIANKIAMKIPFDRILDSFRCMIQDSGLQRHNLVSRKDLHNIARRYNIRSEAVRHANDCPSVESWVKEMEETSSVVQYNIDLENIGGESESSYTDLIICEAGSDDNQPVIINQLQIPGISRQCGIQEHRHRQLLQKFNRCLDVAKSEEACELINECLTALMPTLQAMESTSTLTTLSSGKVSKCEP